MAFFCYSCMHSLYKFFDLCAAISQNGYKHQVQNLRRIRVLISFSCTQFFTERIVKSGFISIPHNCLHQSPNGGALTADWFGYLVTTGKKVCSKSGAKSYEIRNLSCFQLACHPSGPADISHFLAVLYCDNQWHISS